VASATQQHAAATIKRAQPAVTPEHNAEIFGPLGVSAAEIKRLREKGVL
jgi:crotonobetainyl-CoA:carnitine CoA-transferase CaiB-like acyl-CoA transferase